MELYYKKLSDGKREELAAREFRDMYGNTENFLDKSVVSENEDIVFRQMAHPHTPDELPDEYFLQYQGWTFVIYACFRSSSGEDAESGKDGRGVYEITKIVDWSLNGGGYDIKDVIEVIREALALWDSSRTGKSGDRATAEVRTAGAAKRTYFKWNSKNITKIFTFDKRNKKTDGMGDGELYYRELSDGKREELAARGYKNMYGTRKSFRNECVVSKRENIIFEHMACSHLPDELPDEFFLQYKDWIFVIYTFFQGSSEKNLDGGQDYHDIYQIAKIVDLSVKRIREYDVEEVMEAIREILSLWDVNNTGILGIRDKVTVEVEIGKDIKWMYLK